MHSSEIRDHLENTLIPFWARLIDRKSGGFYGLLNSRLVLEPEAEKYALLQARILWFFSSASKLLKKEELLPYAEHVYRFLREKCLDTADGGVFWSVSYDGKPLCTDKYTYLQAFAIYGLCAYYEVGHCEEALEIALDLFELVESRCRDVYGYIDALDRNFRPIKNVELSENGLLADKTMNTLLHVLEAYTELYRVSGKLEVGQRLVDILDCFYARLYNHGGHRLEVFLDKKMNSLVEMQSFGHDIEASWLLDRSMEILDIRKQEWQDITLDLAEGVYCRGYHRGSFYNESFQGKLNTRRDWWVHAEGVVGFANAWQKTGDYRYLQAAIDVWQYIKAHFWDKRPGSEWYWQLHGDGRPVADKPIAGTWKCPYHNGRMCIELLRRGIDVSAKISGNNDRLPETSCG